MTSAQVAPECYESLGPGGVAPPRLRRWAPRGGTVALGPPGALALPLPLGCPGPGAAEEQLLLPLLARGEHNFPTLGKIKMNGAPPAKGPPAHCAMRVEPRLRLVRVEARLGRTGQEGSAGGRAAYTGPLGAGGIPGLRAPRPMRRRSIAAGQEKLRRR